MISLAVAWVLSSFIKHRKFGEIEASLGIFVITGVLDVAIVIVIMYGLSIILK